MTVLGDHIEEELAIYDLNLPIEPFKQHLSRLELEVGIQPDGHDDLGAFIWVRSNPRGKFDWKIMGGRWCGYLKLKHGAYGEIGKRGAGIAEDDPLPYGSLSADQALYGDIDWYGMRQRNRGLAAQFWGSATIDNAYLYGIESDMTEDDYLIQRSHPATFALLKNSEWYERAPTGWWGPMLDADSVKLWHDQWDELMSSCTPDTLVTIIDCHVASQI